MASAIRFVRDGAWLQIRLANAARRNALGPEDWIELAELLQNAASSGVEIISLTGEGPVFCAGVDRSMLAAAQKEVGGLVSQVRHVGMIVQTLETSPAIVIAALNGPAVGIGVHLALAADFTLACRDAFLWLPEAAMGIPDVQHHRMLAERLGKHRALEFALLGRRLAAEEAQAAGLIGTLVDTPDLIEGELAGLVARIQAVPVSVRSAIKRAALAQVSIGDPDAQAEAVSQ
ncbi:enoyl-CoA hydratase/isomerase family protein [Roseiarcaceae bacterium H3SJ34-1]|uniref:enoyl-CoA hydratase/isomerase family protein n=1 Tax=Terripilifer ovatus TaxID=3032367 RepID=UPI003AB9A15D|nr:enoyl-CoA hydratase/isomerase family protein [Roseiarcaceae bacterium H3SJ34-1]